LFLVHSHPMKADVGLHINANRLFQNGFFRHSLIMR
jgi:hypothetical protein